MMKDVFIIISLLPDEHMGKKATEMLSELEKVENLHGIGGLGKGWSSGNKVNASSVSSEPSREETSVLDQQKGRNGAETVVDSRIGPFN